MEKTSIAIFPFGDVDSGKSTILAALYYYIRCNYISLIDSNEGNRYMSLTSAKLNDKNFPDPLPCIVEYDINFRKTSMDKWVNLNFLEASGEYHIVIKAEKGGEFCDEIDAFLEKKDTPMLYLLIVGFDDLIFKESSVPAQNQDALMRKFIGYLIGNNIEYPNIALVISKYDKDKTMDMDFDVFVKKHLPSTLSLLEKIASNTKIFPFSIGSVTRENTIQDLNLSDCKQIIDWIMEIFVKKDIVKTKRNYKFLEYIKGLIWKPETKNYNMFVERN